MAYWDIIFMNKCKHNFEHFIIKKFCENIWCLFRFINIYIKKKQATAGFTMYIIENAFDYHEDLQKRVRKLKLRLFLPPSFLTPVLHCLLSLSRSCLHGDVLDEWDAVKLYIDVVWKDRHGVQLHWRGQKHITEMTRHSSG